MVDAEIGAGGSHCAPQILGRYAGRDRHSVVREAAGLETAAGFAASVSKGKAFERAAGLCRRRTTARAVGEGSRRARNSSACALSWIRQSIEAPGGVYRVRPDGSSLGVRALRGGGERSNVLQMSGGR